MSIFYPLEVTGRSSDTQLQVGEKYFFKCSALRVKLCEEVTVINHKQACAWKVNNIMQLLE